MTPALIGYEVVSELSKRLYLTRRGDERFVLKTFASEPPPGVQRAAKLQGPWVAQLREVGLFDSRHAVVSEWVDGLPLWSVLGGGPVPQPVALHIAFQVARAVSAAHELEEGAVIHGALDLTHVLCSSDGAVKVCNFGGGATREGRLRAHRGFVAPEVLSGGEADVLSDVYACGALGYLLLTGKTPAEAALAHGGETPKPSVLYPGLDAGLDATLLSLVAADPAERAFSVRALTAAIDRYAEVLGLELDGAPLAALVTSRVRARAA